MGLPRQWHRGSVGSIQCGLGLASVLKVGRVRLAVTPRGEGRGGLRTGALVQGEIQTQWGSRWEQRQKP